jgi:hypothetical protein
MAYWPRARVADRRLASPRSRRPAEVGRTLPGTVGGRESRADDTTNRSPAALRIGMRSGSRWGRTRQRPASTPAPLAATARRSSASRTAHVVRHVCNRSTANTMALEGAWPTWCCASRPPPRGGRRLAGRPAGRAARPQEHAAIIGTLRQPGAWRRGIRGRRRRIGALQRGARAPSRCRSLHLEALRAARGDADSVSPPARKAPGFRLDANRVNDIRFDRASP